MLADIYRRSHSSLVQWLKMDDNKVMKKVHILFIVFLPLLCLLGCGSSKQPEEVTEIPTTEAPLMDQPEIELYETAKRYFRNGAYQVALDAFQSIRDGYPMGPYARFAEIKIGDCLFLQRNYLEAIAAYEEALHSRPGSEEIAYLLLQLGRSHHFLNTDIGRDRGPLEKALEYYSRITNEHENSPYYETANRFRANVLADLAEHEKMVAEFYRRQEQEDAYRVRDTRYKEQLEEKERVANTKKERPTLLASLTVLESIDSATAPKPRPTSGGTSKIESSLLRQVECRRKTPPVVELTLTRALEETPKVIESSDGNVTIDLVDSFSESQVNLNCFGKGDLEIQGNLLKLTTDSKVRIVQTSYPARVMLFLIN